MRNEVKKTSFRYFDDKNAGIHCINKKQNNFDRYIEEIVKKKRRKTQYIDEHYFSNTPIDLCNNNIHHKVTKKNNCDISLKKKIVSDESEITKQNKTDTVTNRNINVFKETSRSSVDLNNNCLEKSKKINIVSNIQLCPPIFDLNSVNCLRELKFSNKSICDDVLPFNCVSKVENDAIEVKRNNFDSKLSNIEPNLEVFEVEDSDEEIVFIADVTPPKIQSRPLNRSNHTAPLPKGWLSKSNKTYFTCAICKSKFRDATAFRSHVFLHESEKYKCNVCSKKYRREYHLRQHVRKSHNY